MEREEDILSAKGRSIGGWLILLLIGLVYTSFMLPYIAAVNLFPALTQKALNVFTGPENVYYIPYYKVLLSAEIVVDIATAIAGILLLVMMIRRLKNFLKWMIIFLSIILPISCAKYVAVYLPPPLSLYGDYFAASSADENNKWLIVGMLVAIVVTVVGILYFLYSNRVKETFVK